MVETVATETVVVLGDAKSESMYFFLMALFFTAIAGFVFRQLAYETAFRKEVSTAFKRPLPPMQKVRALVWILPFWLLAVGWFYNATLGKKFFELRKEGEGAEVVWTFVYKYPEREKRVPNDEILSWGGYVIWKRRYVKHALDVHTKTGERFMAAGLHPDEFRNIGITLRGWGIDIATDEPESLPPPR